VKVLLPKVRAHEGTSVRAELRRACDASHQRMHGLEPFLQIAAGTLPMSRYQLVLLSLFEFHSAVARVAKHSEWPELSSAERRLNMLRSDLAFLGVPVPALTAKWDAGGGEAVLGALYAAEGSMLGGRVIARQLDYLFNSQVEGRRFFIGDVSDRAHWAQLLMVLEARCTERGALNAAIRGALRTFDLFEQCAISTSQVSPMSVPHEPYCVPRRMHLSSKLDTKLARIAC
jgi:heme oxygenase